YRCIGAPRSRPLADDANGKKVLRNIDKYLGRLDSYLGFMNTNGSAYTVTYSYADQPPAASNQEASQEQTHSIVGGYLFWILGFTGSHRFFFGKPLSGLLWLCTLGLLGVGWLIDLFLIPGMAREAAIRYRSGP